MNEQIVWPLRFLCIFVNFKENFSLGLKLTFMYTYVGFEVYTAVVLKSSIIWNVMPSSLSLTDCAALSPRRSNSLYLKFSRFYQTCYTTLFYASIIRWTFNQISLTLRAILLCLFLFYDEIYYTKHVLYQLHCL
jgi:hypothetical protein